MSRQFQDIIGGKAVEAASGKDLRHREPRDRRGVRGAGLGRGGRGPRHARGRGRVRGGGDHPRRTAKALLKIADALEERSAEFVKARSANTGKPLGLTESKAPAWTTAVLRRRGAGPRGVARPAST